tara:strand:- start:4163 stop:4570 length:408 start_codon:yes stop_codon:yes gene_type:complete
MNKWLFSFLFSFSLIGFSTTAQTNADTTVYTLVEEMPHVEGGDADFFKQLGENITYPPIAKNDPIISRFVCQFIVETDSSISNVAIILPKENFSFKEELTQNIEGTLQNMTWIPGQQDGKPVRVQFIFPIRICSQ